MLPAEHEWCEPTESGVLVVLSCVVMVACHVEIPSRLLSRDEETNGVPCGFGYMFMGYNHLSNVQAKISRERCCSPMQGSQQQPGRRRAGIGLRRRCQWRWRRQTWKRSRRGRTTKSKTSGCPSWKRCWAERWLKKPPNQTQWLP
jgi:hypothetical protein